MSYLRLDLETEKRPN